MTTREVADRLVKSLQDALDCYNDGLLCPQELLNSTALPLIKAQAEMKEATCNQYIPGCKAAFCDVADRQTAPVVVAWNTERMYSSQGQRIAAKVICNGCVAFWDIDRGINGVTTHPLLNHDLKKFVLNAYDRSEYNQGFWPLSFEESHELDKELIAAAEAVGKGDKNED